MLKLQKIKRIPKKLKREFLRIPPIKTLSEQAYQKSLAQHRNNLPSISSDDSPVLDSLQQEGVFVTSLDSLAIPATDLFKQAAQEILSDLQSLPTNSKSVVVIPDAQIADYPDLILWGVEERLLNIIENYIGMPVRYYGAGVRRELANGKTMDVRQWHRDIDDRRMLKIIIYLNDVDIAGAPFEYIPQSLTLSASEKIKYSSGFIGDQKMQAIVSSSEWKTCTGNYGTVIFAGTSHVFHRAKTPVGSDRFSITYAYTSINPVAPLASRLESTMTQNQWQAIADRLNARQRKCF